MKFRNKKIIYPFMGVLLLFGCGGGQEDNTTTEVKVNITVCNPIEKNITKYLTLNGTTLFIKKEIVRAVFQGYIVKSFKSIGDKINNGEPLFLIKTKEASAVDSSNNYDLTKFKGEITVYAKSSGVLSQMDYNTGDYVSDGEQIAVISNPSSLKINLSVPYDQISSIRINGVCCVELPDGKSITGIISKKIPSVEQATQTQTFMVDVPNDASLPENLNVNIKIPVKEFKNSIVLPKSAIMSSDVLDEFWIMKLINDTTAVKVNIQKGIEEDENVQILSPKLNKEERIVLVGAYGLPDTAFVKIGK